MSDVCHALTMEAVVDFEQLCGTHNETVVKELSIAGRNILETSVSESIRYEASWRQ